MELIVITIALVAFGLLYRSSFLQVLGGVVAIAFGVYWMVLDPSFIYLIEGIVSIGAGIYLLIMVAVDFVKGS